MGDKFIIMLLVLFIMVGIFTYDRYLVSKGEDSPLAELLDYAGLSKYLDLSPKEGKTKISSFKEDLNRLAQKHHEIENKRTELIEKRNAILVQLKDINNHVVEEGRKYAAMIDQDRKEFMEQFPHIETLGRRILKTQEEADPQKRQEEYLAIKQELLEILEDDFENPIQDIPELNQFLSMSEKFVKGASIPECDDSQVCLERQFNKLEYRLTTVFKNMVDRPEKDIKEFLKLTKRLNREYQLMEDNSISTEDQLQRINSNYDSKFQELTRQLVQVTDDELQNLLRLYKELWQEQKILLDNLDLNRQRLYQSHESINRDAQAIMQRLKRFSRHDPQQLIMEYNRIQMQRNDMLQRFDTNEINIRGHINNQWQENKKFFSNYINSNTQAFIQNNRGNKYALQNKIRHHKEKIKITDRHIQSRKDQIQANKNHRNSKIAIKSPPRAIRAQQSIRQNSDVKEKMRRLRDQARDQGYYNPVTYSNY